MHFHNKHHPSATAIPPWNALPSLLSSHSMLSLQDSCAVGGFNFVGYKSCFVSFFTEWLDSAHFFFKMIHKCGVKRQISLINVFNLREENILNCDRKFPPRLHIRGELFPVLTYYILDFRTLGQFK